MNKLLYVFIFALSFFSSLHQGNAQPFSYSDIFYSTFDPLSLVDSTGMSVEWIWRVKSDSRKADPILPQSSSTQNASTSVTSQDPLSPLPQEIIGKDGMPMALVPSGEFFMGSKNGHKDEKPVHKVFLDAFYLDKYEVTVSQYAKFLGVTEREAPDSWETMNQTQHLNRPIVDVRWRDADAYCHWVNKRLPTEAEWEKAARGQDERMYPWGDDHQHSYMLTSGNISGTAMPF